MKEQINVNKSNVNKSNVNKSNTNSLNNLDAINNEIQYKESEIKSLESHLESLKSELHQLYIEKDKQEMTMLYAKIKEKGITIDKLMEIIQSI